MLTVAKLASHVAAIALAAVATSCAPLNSQTPATGTGGGAAAPATSSGASSAQGSMPNLVGSNLDDAKATLQELVHKFWLPISSSDVSGHGRHVIADRDWKVCNQSVPPGGTFTTTTKLTLGVVKTAENCP